MIANIPLVTGNKLNCFISAMDILTTILHCAFVLLVLSAVDLYIFSKRNPTKQKLDKNIV